MVHSGISFWSRKVCKRRRFLSDPRNSLFLSQSSQDPFRTVLTDSGGPSLPSLTRCEPALKASWLLLGSGNMGTRPLPSAEGPKVTVVLVGKCTIVPGTCTGCARDDHVRDGPGSGPPIKVAGGQNHTFDGNRATGIPYRV